MDNENISTEQTPPDNTVGAEVSAFGKFASIDELVKAYDSLQKEFTRRCQKLKELERQSENSCAFGEKEKDAFLKQKMSDESFVEEYIIADPKITGEVVARYLGSLACSSQMPILRGSFGTSALTPVARPKTLDEAKRLADKLF